VFSRRGLADEKESNAATGPNHDVLGHVSEEAADMGKMTGETEPDLGQGTPVQDVCIKDISYDIRAKDNVLSIHRFSSVMRKAGTRLQK
jgi:hypothetical protein